jgi:hypothetical protein
MTVYEVGECSKITPKTIYFPAGEFRHQKNSSKTLFSDCECMKHRFQASRAYHRTIRSSNPVLPRIRATRLSSKKNVAIILLRIKTPSTFSEIEKHKNTPLGPNRFFSLKPEDHFRGNWGGNCTLPTPPHFFGPNFFLREYFLLKF